MITTGWALQRTVKGIEAHNHRRLVKPEHGQGLRDYGHRLTHALVLPLDLAADTLPWPQTLPHGVPCIHVCCRITCSQGEAVGKMAFKQLQACMQG